MGNRIKKHLTITLSPGAFTKLESMAARAGLDRSNMVESLLLGDHNRVEKGSPKPQKDYDEMYARMDQESARMDQALADVDETLRKRRVRS